ncbi:MAG: UDP-3-O-acyl-N-acetylglucosamine deacetylase [Deltaproteobacteria bacterium]|nr:MAG: UDP-3-O-acyl-N-acetylglucosamine deacetylase [Deltaproteobacteria bacterium]
MMDLHPFRQRTFRQRASIDGVGLHSGAKVRLTLAPAPPYTGIVFCSDGVEIPALAENVVDTRLNTSLGRANVRIGTVEHVLAALCGSGIDNAYVEVEGPEVPILDGSSAPFVQLIHDAGVHEQQRTTRRFLLLRKPVVAGDDEKAAKLVPSRTFRITYTIDFQHPLISDQSYGLVVSERSFQKEIARARTFGFKRDVEKLHAAGLARGGSLDNAVVVGRDHVLNVGGLRYADEFVRHKLLDAFGDLYLAGGPLLGSFRGVRSGHAHTRRLLATLFADREAWCFTTLSRPTHRSEPAWQGGLQLASD